MIAGEPFDVAIAGYGPVGALLANALGMRGLRVAVFERYAEIFAAPRAVHVDAEAMRVFQSVGLAQEILPWTIPTRGMEFVDSKGKRYFGTAERGSPPAESRLGWFRGYMFYQPHLERALRAGVARFPSVQVHLRHQVESIAQSGADDRVQLSVRDLESGSATVCTARYLVGCDGAQSATRGSFGGGLESLGYERRWLVVDVFLRREVDLPAMSQQICDPARATTFIFSAGRHRRWELQLQPGESADDMERPGTVARLLARWLEPGDAEIARAAVYAFRGVVASPWRDRRVLLAGDSAHQMPPFQGQGLCAGIRDVANLAWKLAFVLDGRASDALLESYEQERAHHARGAVASSIEVGRLIDLLAAAEARGEPFRDPAREANATRKVGWLPKLRSGLMPPLPEEDPGPVGEPLVQPRVRLRSGVVLPLDEALGADFAVIAREDPAGLLRPASREFLDRIGTRLLAASDLHDLDGWLDELLRRYAALVVRPDRYVLDAAADGDALEAVVERLRRGLGPTPTPCT